MSTDYYLFFKKVFQKKLKSVIFLLLLKPNETTSGESGQNTLQQPDHIIFCWLENKDYEQIIGNTDAPFINSLLKQGTVFSNMHALGHPSYPQYISFFAGTNNGVTSDNCIDSSNWNIANLYTELKSAQKTFAWYSENLPATGSTICASGIYFARHNPTTLFANVPSSQNKKFSDFPADFSALENVVCITPNIIDDMHSGTVKQGDLWVQRRLSSLIQWCISHNSIFVIYFDEDNGESANRIPVIAVGQHVKTNYQLNTFYDHYNWTRTICSLMGASTDWTPNLESRETISGCWNY